MRLKVLLIGFCVFLLFPHISASAEIKDAESQAHAADAASNLIVDTYEFPGFKVIQFTLPVLSVYSYLLVSDGEALMVDPVRDIAFYEQVIKKEGVKVKGVYLTHSHADFIAGHLEMVRVFGCPIYQSRLSGAKYTFKPVDEKTVLEIGKARIQFLDTPGHTPDGMCAVVSSKEKPGDPLMLFTGDVLFVGSVGRPDLLEGTVSAAWLAGAMFDSWTQKLSKLPDSAKIFPAHGAGSLCGAHLSEEPVSTIGHERATNPNLKYTKRGEFIAVLLSELPAAPQYFAHNARMNREGPPLVDWKAPAPSELKPDAQFTDPEKWHVADMREADEYAKGHIPKSVNIGLRGRFETWIGTMIPWGAKLALVGKGPEQFKEALFRLHRIGYTGEVIAIDSWKKAGLQVNVGAPIKPRELYGLMGKGEAPVIVDVRLPAEWMALRIGTVLNLPLNKLAELSRLLDPNEPVVVVCNSAYRSSMAAGILERKGFLKARNLDGGSEAWIKDGLPVIEPAKPGTAEPKAAQPKRPSGGC
jgi:glyoxylase-like metal-dependent hydrolase (beta-lactamase superfamily II)/rhodanese-related sulfurtransferase